MKWEAPAPKMRDEVLAMKAVWESWQGGKRLDYQGRFFKLDLMTPFFSPGPVRHPAIPIYVAGVNEGMCRVAGEVADGLHVHPLHTVRYLKEVVRPALEAGAVRAGRKGRVPAAASVFAAVGGSSQEVRSVREAYREQVSFYASTRSYRKVMELHGWGDVCDRLHALSVKGEWRRMAAGVTDDILDAFVVEGTWDEIGGAIRGRYGDLLDRVRLYLPFDGDESWQRIVRGFRA